MIVTDYLCSYFVNNYSQTNKNLLNLNARNSLIMFYFFNENSDVFQTYKRRAGIQGLKPWSRRQT